MAATLGQVITIENVSGAGSTIGTGRVARAAPDGLTLLVHQPALATNATFFPKLPFNSEKDLTGIGLINYSPYVLLARNTLPANSLAELVDWIRQTGAHVKYALSGGPGSIGHLVAVVFASSAGIQLEYIPYRGASPALTDLIAGHVDISFLAADVAVEQIKSGQGTSRHVLGANSGASRGGERCRIGPTELGGPILAGSFRTLGHARSNYSTSQRSAATRVGQPINGGFGFARRSCNIGGAG